MTVHNYLKEIDNVKWNKLSYETGFSIATHYGGYSVCVQVISAQKNDIYYHLPAAVVLQKGREGRTELSGLTLS